MNHTIESLKEQVKELRRQKKNLQSRIKYYTNWEENKKKKRDEKERYRQTDKGKEADRKYCKNNIEKERKRKKKYSQSENGTKSKIIANWKYQGLITDDYHKVYERFEYTLFCDECRCDLDQCTKSVKCMDHDHSTGLFRNILCRSCNIKRG